MKNFSKRKDFLTRKVADMKANLKNFLCDESGQLSSEHMGWIAGALVIIGVIMVFTIPALKDTVLPNLQSAFMKIFSYHG